MFHVICFFGAQANASDITKGTEITADSATITNNSSVLFEGNVSVNYGDQYIKSDTLFYDRESTQIFITGIKEYFDGEKLSIKAKTADITWDLQNGIIKSAEILIDKKIKLIGETVELESGDISKVSNIVSVTTCETCNNETPLWHFSAKSAKRHPNIKQSTYYDVILHLKGLPIFYTPYLRLPDPSVKRARGFLLPTLLSSSTLGNGLRVPYFFPIGPDKDFLLTPLLSAKTSTTEYRYRQKFINGNLSLSGAFSKDWLSPNKLRWYYDLEGDYNFSNGSAFEISLGRYSDDAYLGDYNYFIGKNIQNNEVTSLSYGKESISNELYWSGSINLAHTSELHQKNNLNLSTAAEFNHNFTSSYLNNPINIKGYATAGALIDKNNFFTRSPGFIEGTANWKKQLFSKYGLGLKIEFEGKSAALFSTKSNGKILDENLNSIAFGTKISWPMISQSRYNTHLLEPSLSVRYRNVFTQSNVNEFRAPQEFGYGNLHSISRISSPGRYDKGAETAIGLKYRFRQANDLKINFYAGQSFKTNFDNNYSKTSGLQSKKSNVFVMTDFRFGERYSARLNGLIDQKGHLEKTDLSFNAEYENVTMSASYDFLPKQLIEERENDTSNTILEINFSPYKNLSISSEYRYDLISQKTAIGTIGVRYDINSNWHLQAYRRYSIIEDIPSLRKIGFFYEDECTNFSLGFEERDDYLGASKPASTISVQIYFKPFAKFYVGSDGSGNLRTN